MNRQPLDGISVLDFGQVYNGPYCGFLLAQAGARVIKVESLIGETLRARGSKSAASYPFALLNTNKECIALNIKSAEGQQLLKRLVQSVDVVLENFAPAFKALSVASSKPSTSGRATCSAYLRRKTSASRGTSSGRSRRGGSVKDTTLTR